MKKSLFRTLALLLVIALVLPCAAFAADDDINVTVYGEPVVWTDAKPFIDENGRTLVPLRAVADAMGLDVEWDAANRVAIFSYTESGTYEADWTYNIYDEIRFPIDSTVAYGTYTYTDASGEDVTTEEIQMDTAAVIVNDRTYAPIRYLAEYFDYAVEWDAETRTASIDIATYILYWSTFSQYEDAVGIYFYPGERYDEMESIEVVAARVDGAAADFDVMTESELQTLNDEMGINAVYAFYISGNFISPDMNNIPTYEIEWDLQWTYADGTVDPELETCSWDWYCEGYGGY